MTIPIIGEMNASNQMRSGTSFTPLSQAKTNQFGFLGQDPAQPGAAGHPHQSQGPTDLARLPEVRQKVSSAQHQNTMSPDQLYQDPGQEQIEELQNKLKTYEVHESNWVYYFTEPKHWDFNLEDESGLCKGTRAVLLDSAPCFPIWVHKDYEQQFKQLRAKMRQLLSVHDQIKEFKETAEPSENFFKDSLKEATKKATRLDLELKAAGQDVDNIVDEGNIFDCNFIRALGDSRKRQ